VNVTLLYFDDCPNWLEADAHLRLLADEFADLHITAAWWRLPKRLNEPASGFAQHSGGGRRPIR